MWSRERRHHKLIFAFDKQKWSSIMTAKNEAAQAVCFGCTLNPHWYNPPYPNPFQQQTFFTPTFFDNLALAKLTPQEEELLKKLGEAFSIYSSLDKRSEADNKEFTDAIHRAQQLIALRVARRVNPEVWAQPE